MAVAHWADVETQLSLDVALFKELLHYTVGPLTVQVERFGRVAQVSTVDHILKHLSFNSVAQL